MTAYILDAVRTPRAKARPDGGLAALKPHELVGGLIDAALISLGHKQLRLGIATFSFFAPHP